MGKFLNKLHVCAEKYAEEAEEDGESDRLPRGNNGIDRRIGEVKRYSNQHGEDGDDRQGAYQNAHVDAGIIYQAFWSDGVEFGQGTSRTYRGGGVE